MFSFNFICNMMRKMTMSSRFFNCYVLSVFQFDQYAECASIVVNQHLEINVYNLIIINSRFFLQILNNQMIAVKGQGDGLAPEKYCQWNEQGQQN